MGKSKFRPKKWIISDLDVDKVKRIKEKTKPPVTHDEAVALYITLWDTFAEMLPKYLYAHKKMPRLERQLKYWKDKANKAKPRMTPLKYD